MQRSILLAGAVLFSGCGIIQFPAANGAETGVAFDGQECHEVRQTADDAQKAHGSGPVGTATTTREKVLVAICPSLEFDAHDMAGRPYQGTRYQTRALPHPEDIHVAFDIRHPQMIDIATLIISTSSTGEGPYRGRPASKAAPGAVEKPFGDDRAERGETALGMAAVYTGFMDEAALDQELAKANLPAAALGTYKTLLVEDSHKVANAVNAMKPGVKKVVYDLPLAIATREREEIASKKALSDMLDALAAKADAARAGNGDAVAVARDLTALRSNVWNACGATEACSYHPLYIEATHELATLYIAAKMPNEARAESAVLSRKDSLRQTFQAAVYAAQTEAGAKATRALATKKEAGKMDAKLAKVMDTEDAVSFSFASFYRADMSMPFLAGVMSAESKGSGRATQGYVQSVTPKGENGLAETRPSPEMSLVEFRTEYVNEEVPYNCVRTGRIDRIDRDGKIQYEEECQYRSERRALDKPDPVLIPSSEAKGLKQGELLAVWVTGKEGSVFEARAPKKEGSPAVVTQIRGDRLIVTKAGK